MWQFDVGWECPECHLKHVGGKSDTLRIGSRKEDERTINLYNYEHGIKGL